jgi:F0F1-type ATP synthase membrane subunit c/vacuolar-type H+-ATPase subunit K
MSKPPEFDKAFAASLRIAWILGGCLPLYLLLEEILRARFRPFLGFAGVKDAAGLRYGCFLAAVAAVIALRLVHGRRLSAAAQAGDAVRSLYRTAVISLTLAEIPALAGMVLFLLAGLNRDFYFLLFASSVLVFMYFPRASAWETILERRRPGCPL